MPLYFMYCMTDLIFSVRMIQFRSGAALSSTHSREKYPDSDPNLKILDPDLTVKKLEPTCENNPDPDAGLA